MRQRWLESKLELDSHPTTTIELQAEIRKLQADIDRAVNNAAVTKNLAIEIRCNPSALTFSLAGAIAQTLPQMEGIQLVLLMDEFENLTARQQIYVNTIIREKPVALNIVVGSRRYGIKTDHETFAAGEVNRRGSEFDEVVLEDFYKGRKGRYEEFCNRLVERRLREAHFPLGVKPKDLFLTPTSGDNVWWSAQGLSVVRGAIGLERPHMSKLNGSLRRYNGCPGQDPQEIVEALRFDEHPVVEKFAVLLLYRRWANSGFVEASHAVAIRDDCVRMIQEEKAARGVRSSFQHYRTDLYAQLRQEAELPQALYGISNFILMSGYLPRNLLMTLKQVSRWAAFLGEDPTEGSPMSLAAQQRGVSDASEWFVGNSRALGRAGHENEIVIGQIGSFLRQLRFADKPNEVSVCTFSISPRDLTEETSNLLTSAKLHSVLIEHSEGHRTKNRENIGRKFQIHPMLCPKFGLPVARRGTINLNSEEAAVLLSSRSSDADLRRIARMRLSLMDAPFRPGWRCRPRIAVVLMIDYGIFNRGSISLESVASMGPWDYYVSSYTGSQRVTDVFTKAVAGEKVWVLEPAYNLSDGEVPLDGSQFVSSSSEIETWVEFLEIYPRIESGASLCVDITGFTSPTLLAMLYVLKLKGVSNFTALYSSPQAYVSGEQTAFRHGPITEVRQVQGYEGSHLPDAAEDDVVLIGTGYEDEALRRVADDKASCTKIQLFGLPSLQPHMYQENQYRASMASESLGTLAPGSTLFAPAGDPFATASVLADALLSSDSDARFENVYLSPLGSKAQVLGFGLFFLNHLSLAPASIILPFADHYARETSLGLSRIWQYQIELDLG